MARCTFHHMGAELVTAEFSRVPVVNEVVEHGGSRYRVQDVTWSLDGDGNRAHIELWHTGIASRYGGGE